MSCFQVGAKSEKMCQFGCTAETIIVSYFPAAFSDFLALLNRWLKYFPEWDS